MKYMNFQTVVMPVLLLMAALVWMGCPSPTPPPLTPPPSNEPIIPCGQDSDCSGREDSASCQDPNSGTCPENQCVFASLCSAQQKCEQGACCAPVAGDRCGCQDQGTFKCDGTCSVATTFPNDGDACGDCNDGHWTCGTCVGARTIGDTCGACNDGHMGCGGCEGATVPGAMCGDCNDGVTTCNGGCEGAEVVGQPCGCGGTSVCGGGCTEAAPPSNYGQPCGCDDDQGAIKCDGTCSKPCIRARFDWIDDEAYVWWGPVNNCDFSAAAAFCQINQGPVPRSGSCDITPAALGGASSGQIIIKVGNPGCANSHGDMYLDVNGSEAWHGHKGDTGIFTHCGWTYREVLNVDLVLGTVQVVDDCYVDGNGTCCYNVSTCSC